MASLSSDEEDCQLPFWNNWLPSSDKITNKTDSLVPRKRTKKFVYDSLAFSSINFGSFANDSKHGNWIPPVKFWNFGVQKKKGKPVLERKDHHKTFVKNIIKETVAEVEKQESHIEGRKTPLLENSISCKRDVSFDWGQRTQLHDVTKFNDGDLIWGIVNLGVFAHIELWINDYGSVCASADGKISKLGSTETTFISITNAKLLSKMLGLSSVQWVSLCETIQENKCVLKFDAFKEFNLIGKNSLEKLWFFICKRRHFLPDQCMLVKLSGAVKCMKKFTIIPKIVVQEIRSFPRQSVVQPNFLDKKKFETCS